MYATATYATLLALFILFFAMWADLYIAVRAIRKSTAILAEIAQKQHAARHITTTK